MNKSFVLPEKFELQSHEIYENAKPFSHMSLVDAFDSSTLENLLSELETLEYYIEDHDLYQFLRTTDFKHSKNKAISEFREFIFSDYFISLIENIVGLKLLRGRGDLHSLKLINTQYLLCHDDQVQDRAVAFILNLSKNWSSKDGGNLELFSLDSNGNPLKVVKSLSPEFNQFNMFTVSPKSFHQISEVLNEDKKRISISGWFYLKTKAEGKKGPKNENE